MDALNFFLTCLLISQVAEAWKIKRGHRYAVREAVQNAEGGYHYNAPSGGSAGVGGAAESMMSHHETMASFGAGGGGVASDSGADGGYHYENPVAPSPSLSPGGTPTPGFEDIQSFSSGVTAALENGASEGQSYSNGASAGTYTQGGETHGAYDFNTVLNSVGSIGSGSSDQFAGVQGEVIDENPPSIFKYKPEFGGKDINNLPHILPPGGKSIHELQEEADAKLRAIVAKAKMNQMEVVERIAKLKTNYGYGTLGFDGYKDTRYEKMGKIDLGTHKAIDLGTSIDYNRLKGSDGKLRLPVQNVYHTKTLGIHIPEPYPVKHEVAVPAPFPVVHPIPVPHHKPQKYSPLSHEDVEHLSADDGRGSAFGHLSFGTGGSGSYGVDSFGGKANLGGFNFGSDFGFQDKGAAQSFKGISSGTVTIEPSQSISESSSVGGLPYGAGTPNAADHAVEGGNGDEGHMDFEEQSHQQPTVNTFGLPPGASSGALSSYEGPAERPSQEYGSPSISQGQAISSEAGTVHIPPMNFGHNRDLGNRPQSEYGPPQ